MNDSTHQPPPTDTETILMALDQISQTIDAVTNVVGRLRAYVQARDARAGAGSTAAIPPLEPNPTIH